MCTLEVNIKEGAGPQHPLPVSNLVDHHLNYHRPAEWHMYSVKDIVG
jgi:hypothetical protein